MPTLADVVAVLDEWYPPATADGWDAVGLVGGDPADEVRRVLFAVDPAPVVATEAAEWGADLLIVHHPLFLKGIHGVAATTPKGRTFTTLMRAGCALFTAHTNADQAVDGVSQAMADALGLADQRPLVPAEATDGDMGSDTGSDRGSDTGSDRGSDTGSTGTGRIGTIAPTTLRAFAAAVAEALPATVHGVRVAGDPDRAVRTVALCGGAGDFLLDRLATSAADVYVTSDLRHHPAAEFLEKDGPALVDVAHWAAEWTWLPVVSAKLAAALGNRVETRVSTTVTDPWTFRA